MALSEMWNRIQMKAREEKTVELRLRRKAPRCFSYLLLRYLQAFVGLILECSFKGLGDFVSFAPLGAGIC